MRTTRTMAMAVGAALLATGLFAAPSVEITSVQQQYPWTNTVDIVYTVAGVESETNGYFVVFTPTTSTGEPILDVNGEKSVQVALKGSGVYSTQWFPQTNLQYTACKMTPSVFRGAAKDYMIVDLLTGEVTYEPMATQEASNQRYNTDEYKTTKMVFRRIEPGTYDVMDGARTAFMEKPYYMGVFTVTEAQYNTLAGSGERTSKIPKQYISWNEIRDSALPKARVPDTGSGPLAKLNARVHTAGNTALYFDIPNQAMWEVACRAKCPATWKRFFSSAAMDDSTGLNDYAWWSGTSNAVQPVGLKKPNPWGLYDMLGNVWEICRDAIQQRAQSSTKNYEDAMSYTQEPITFGTGNGMPGRGGRAGDEVNWVRCSSCVQAHYRTGKDGHFGFRIALIVE